MLNERLAAWVIDKLGGRSACQKRRIVAACTCRAPASSLRRRADRRSQYSPASERPSSNGDGYGRLPTRGSEPEYSEASLDCRLNQFQQRIKPGLVWPHDEKRTRGPEVDPGTDIFCNNKILEEMAEAWKNEMSLG